MSKESNPVRIPYAIRWGKPRCRALKGHPKRVARQERALMRQLIADDRRAAVVVAPRAA